MTKFMNSNKQIKTMLIYQFRKSPRKIGTIIVGAKYLCVVCISLMLAFKTIILSYIVNLSDCLYGYNI